MTSWLEIIAAGVASHESDDPDLGAALGILAEGARALQCGVERRILNRLMTGDPGDFTCIQSNMLRLHLEDGSPSAGDPRFLLRVRSRSGVYVDTLFTATIRAQKTWPVRLSLSDGRERVCHDPTELRRQFMALATDVSFVGRLIAVAEQ